MHCPICRRVVPREQNKWKPFCSERCQLIDFGQWISESYRIPGPNWEQGTSSEDRVIPPTKKSRG